MTLATVGILSIGEMGMGIAKLLIAHDYRVVTNIEGRSEDTHARVTSASIEALTSDTSLVQESDYILSIVPPKDALATAKRVLKAYKALNPKKSTPLFYLDLNAISPRSAREIGSLFEEEESGIKFLDGGIIGSPPELLTSPSQSWTKISIPLSGPSPLPSTHLVETLNINHISPLIGPASGLKCCFASTTKGFTALCIQAFTTAQNLGVLDLLKEELGTRLPGMYKSGENGVTGMPPKAYRWVREMEEIAIAHADDGGFEGDGKGIFDGVAQVYRSVADDTVLGEEKTERRKRGRTIEDVADAVGEGLRMKKRKND